MKVAIIEGQTASKFKMDGSGTGTLLPGATATAANDDFGRKETAWNASSSRTKWFSFI